MLSEDDHARIRSAIAEVERNTAGEIFCVLAQSVSRYREVPLAWAAVAALVMPSLLVLLGLHRLAMADLFSGWADQSLRAVEGVMLRSLTTYTLVQAGIFVAVALIVSLPSVRGWATPRYLKRHRVRQFARQHFAAAGARLSKAEPHILIYASLEDHQVELVAHAAIHQAVGEGPWNQAVQAVIDGMRAGKPADGYIRAVEICGAQLAKHFPPEGPPKNRFSNDILEI